MRELTIKDRRYQIGKVDGWAQFHVARKLAPLLVGLGAVGGALLKGEATKDDFLEAAFDAIEPFTKALSEMSMQDSEYVVKTLLSKVQVAQDSTWAFIQNPQGGMQFDFIDMPTMMQLTVAAIKENLGNFISALPVKVSSPPKA